ncbi:Alpha/Beta hydrolase protein [Exophiala viscosa]|uniref:Alpha/Beta hydrolase protein n=1 Tax=Exophiala viscosa TaxID=2486360 RepID=A0AAN6DVX8_9EURO|nr:Alpha/Beta hydrolase protein [Exophiala viscosa]KAI1623331.1 Alpha/Beta hydrolase protein [Exophiala viscosa]
MAMTGKPLPWDSFPECPGLPDLSTAQTHGLLDLPSGVQMWHAVFGIPLKTTLDAQKAPLIFLHGGVSHSGYHGHQIRHFASKYTIIVYDLRGHGRSPLGPDAKLTYDKLTEDLLGLLNHHSIPKATLIGWSEGCVVSWSFLSQHPDRVERAFHYSAIDDYRKTDGERVAQIQGVKDYFARMEQEWQVLNPAADYGKFIGSYVDMWMREPSWSAETFHNVPVRGEHSAAPIVWVVTADHDDWIPPDHHRRFHSYIRNSSFLEMPGTGHMAFVQTPYMYNKVLEAFLEDGTPTKARL